MGFAPCARDTFASWFGAIASATNSATRRSKPPEQRKILPDSMVVLANDGRLLVRSGGVIHILRRLGGFWGFLAGVIAVIPRPIRDAVYDIVARIRYHVFGKYENICPVTPPELRARFDD
jgi:predicted DCC family thiol-disulfide oxidoreductase YuxK